MKKPLLFLSLITSVVVFFSACQKELSVETGSTPSKGSLQADGTGDCLPKNVNGIYEAGKVLNATTNYIDVQVNVTTAGSYVIYTDTVNGIYFRSVGVFTAIGMNTVRLKGTGTPVNAGINNYVVTYDASTCAIAVTTLAAGGATPAVMTLAGAPGACMGATVSGPYVAGTVLTAASSVIINVNVTTAGTYNITTVISNGIIFSGSGSVAVGPQTITLTATGTPVTAGPTNIPVTIGTSSCSFSCTVTSSAPVTGDYFPLTANSWWSYDDPDGVFVSGDSLTRLNIDAATYMTNVFRVFQNQNETTPQDSSYFRKTGNNYNELTIADYYTAVIAFDAPVIGEINFLKEGLTTNQTWESAVFTGTSGGIALNLKYVFTCTDANGTANINGNAFTNVYKVTWKPQFKAGPAPAYQDEFVSIESWYAKGIGLIYMKINDLSGTLPSSEIKIKHWKVF